MTSSAPPQAFPPTRWSVVLAAKHHSAPEAAAALEAICPVPIDLPTQRWMVVRLIDLREIEKGPISMVSWGNRPKNQT